MILPYSVNAIRPEQRDCEALTNIASSSLAPDNHSALRADIY